MMITVASLKPMLEYMGFIETTKNYMEKHFSNVGCSMAVDFNDSRLIYPESIAGRGRNAGFSQQENFVVFECVHRLLEKGYRPEHIELEKQWTMGHDPKGCRADICVSDESGVVLIIIECKTWGKEYEKALKNTLNDGAQLFSYWQQDLSAKWLVLYASDFSDGKVRYNASTIDGSDDENIKILAKKDKTIKLFSDATHAKDKYAIWKNTYDCRIHGDLIFSRDTVAYQIGVKPLRKQDLCDFTPDDKIVNRFEEILRHNNVSDKENAFNRLIALFICKLVDESTKAEDDEVEFQYKQGTDTYETLQDRLQRLHKDGMEKFMREEIFYVSAEYPEYLFSHYTGSNRKYAIKDLKRTIRSLKFYSNNDFAFKDVHNEELFYQNGKILVEMVQLFEKYRIIYPSKHQFLGDLFEQLLNKGFKQNEGQFFTPMPITRFIWDCLPVERMVKSERGTVYPKVIDYACGAGHFLTEAVEAINHFARNTGDNAWTRDHIFGIEKDYRLARVAKISLFMNGAGEGNIIFGDGLENESDKGIENNSFDILVANPPYAVKDFKQHLQLKNNGFDLLDSIGLNGSEIEVLFVERIAQLLKPRGIAAVILPSSILSNDSGSYIGAREQLLKNFHLRGIVSLGAKTFGATGTNTVILFLEKFNEPPKQMDLSQDCVDAVFGGQPLTDWTDREILEAYTSQIELDMDTYGKFLTRSYSLDALAEIEYFKPYVEAFAASPEEKKLTGTKAYAKLPKDEKENRYLRRFYTYTHAIEREKLFYFSLVHRQTTVVIIAPADNKAQKEFLGYDWSNRKGNEGIQINTPGGKLYNDADREATGTLAAAVKASFSSVQTDFTEEQAVVAKVVSTKDMLDFSRVGFDKRINLSARKKENIFSKYPIVSLGKIAKIKGGAGFPKKYQGNTNETDIPFYKVGDMNMAGNEKYMLFSRNYVSENTLKELKISIFDPDTIIFPKVGMAIHTNKKRIISKPSAVDNNTMAVSVTDVDKALPKYVFYYLSVFVSLSDYANNANPPSITASTLGEDLKLPLPPLPIQQQIVAECEKIDEQYNQTLMSIQECRKQIEDLFNELDVISRRGVYKTAELRTLVHFNPSKSEVSHNDGNMLVSFVEMASVSNNGFIESKLNKPLSDVRTGSYTYFRENDVIVAKITPCMENGKCAIATGLTNGIGFGSSEFHVLRCTNAVSSKYVFGYLNRDSIRQNAAKQMTGSSGHRRVPVSFYETLRLPMLSLEEQEKITSKMEVFEQKIRHAEEQLTSLSGKQSEILNRYLQ